MTEKNNERLLNEFVHNYWNYYCQLEDDFLATRKYVSFDRKNYSTFSLEFLKLYQAVCSEIDVLGKVMAHFANSEFKPKDAKNNIYKWWFEIQNEYDYSNNATKANKVQLNESCCLYFDGPRIKPWDLFKTEWALNKSKHKYFKASNTSTPKWWSDYNNVKHNRISPSSETGEEANYAKANLGNLMSAYAALFILETAYMQALKPTASFEASLKPSKLFMQ